MLKHMSAERYVANNRSYQHTGYNHYHLAYEHKNGRQEKQRNDRHHPRVAPLATAGLPELETYANAHACRALRREEKEMANESEK